MVNKSAVGTAAGTDSGSDTPCTSTENDAALLLGELVEVRQREAGYRGSWHPARVLKIDFTQGLVEYEKLPSKDGLRRYVPLSEDGSEVLLRPRPPPLHSARTWQRGIWVDAFYKDAWWEGVLMNELSECMQVFFPHQGDKRSFGLTNLRVSQEWNKKTGTWKTKGKCTEFSSIEGRKFPLKRTFAVEPKRTRSSTFEEDGDTSSDEQNLYDWLQRHRKQRKLSMVDSKCKEADVSVCEDIGDCDLVRRTPEDAGNSFIVQRSSSPISNALALVGEDTAEEKQDSGKKQIEVDDGNRYLPVLPVPVEVVNHPAAAENVETSIELLENTTSADEVQEVILPRYSIVKKTMTKSLARDAVCADSPSKVIAFAQARKTARKLLTNSGWTVCQSVRERYSRDSQEPYCVSPEGKLYESLAAACREWIRRNKNAKPGKDRIKLSDIQIVARGEYGYSSEFVAGDSSVAERNNSRTRKAIREPCRTRKRKTITKQEKIKGRSQTGCRLEATRGRREDDEDVRSLTRMTLFSWLIDLGVLRENEKIQYVNKETNGLFTGVATSDGILCSCCKEIFSVPGFQAHTGSSASITASQMRLSDRRSILDCQLAALKAMKVKEKEREAAAQGDLIEVDPNDDTCAVCGNGGQLVCCDHCPSTYHLKCIQLENVPEGDWFCPRCCCAVCGCGLYNPNSLDILYCDQCEREYHANCLSGGMKYKSGDSRFCSRKCLTIFKGLRRLVGQRNALDGDYSWTLLRSELDNQLAENHFDLEAIAENSTRLALALTVIQECFRPMIDPRTETDIVTHVLYNRRGDDKRLDFRGFYTFLLERGDELVSVASIRIHGAHAAEMPFIGTRSQYRRQGMCRRLLNVIELVLQGLDVQTLVLPAIAEFVETWTGAFGFQKLTTAQGIQLMELNVVTFPGTSILLKPLTWLHCGKRPPPREERDCVSLWGEESDDEKQKLQIVVASTELVTREAPSAELQLPPGKQSSKGRGKKLFSTSASSPPTKDDEEEQQESSLERTVVMAKTRSNRVVRTSTWVADGVKSLRRKSEQPPPSELVEEVVEHFLSEEEEPKVLSPTRTFVRRKPEDRSGFKYRKLQRGSANLAGELIPSWPKNKRSATRKRTRQVFVTA